jgi:hypothetical protein
MYPTTTTNPRRTAITNTANTKATRKRMCSKRFICQSEMAIRITLEATFRIDGLQISGNESDHREV